MTNTCGSSPGLQGSISFDYSTNDGECVIGSGVKSFRVDLSKCSDSCIYVYTWGGTTKIARVKAPASGDVILFDNYDSTSRCYHIDTRDIALLRNSDNYYAQVYVEDIDDDTRGPAQDKVVFNYQINSVQNDRSFVALVPAQATHSPLWQPVPSPVAAPGPSLVSPVSDPVSSDSVSDNTWTTLAFEPVSCLTLTVLAFVGMCITLAIIRTVRIWVKIRAMNAANASGGADGGGSQPVAKAGFALLTYPASAELYSFQQPPSNQVPHIALYDYIPNSPGYLHLSKGDVVHIIRSGSAGEYSKGKNESGT